MYSVIVEPLSAGTVQVTVTLVSECCTEVVGAAGEDGKEPNLIVTSFDLFLLVPLAFFDAT